MKGMVSVAQILPVGLLADLEEQKRRDAAFAAQAAPAPKCVTVERPPRVIGDPTREPVNRQAAMMTARAGWLYHPLPAEAPAVPEIVRLRERNAHLERVVESLKLELEAVKKKLFRLMDRRPAQERAGRPAPIVPRPAPSVPAENPKQKLLERLKNG